MRYQDQYDLKALKRYADALNYRARNMNAAGRITAKMLLSLILESGGRCQWCDANIVNQPFEIDHILSLVKRGSNTPDNLAVTCPDCNRRKADQSPIQFALQLVARTGNKTLLIDHLISRYDGEMVVQQRLMFDNDSAADQPEIDISDEDTSSVPPYKW